MGLLPTWAGPIPLMCGDQIREEVMILSVSVFFKYYEGKSSWFLCPFII